MKKFSLVLAVLMMLSAFVFCPGYAAEDATVFVFDFDELPYANGKNGNCFFPNPERVKDASFPEIYTWGSCGFVVDGDYVRADVKAGSMLEFDSMPASYVYNKTMPYLMIAIKANTALEGASFNVVSQGNKFKRTYQANLTGEWQKIVFDLTGADGWTIKGEDGKYTDHAEAVFTEGKFSSGGFRLDLPAGTVTSITFDAIGFFTTEEGAKKYETRENATDISVVKVGQSASSSGATTTPSAGTTDPATPIEPESTWESSIFNALKKDEPVKNTQNFDSVCPTGLINNDGKVITLKYESVTPSATASGAYDTGMENSKIINTYGTIKNVSVEGGLLKIELKSGNLFELTNFRAGLSAGQQPYWIIGYKTEGQGGNVNGYIYNAGNAYRTPYLFKCDGEWHYDVVAMNDTSVIEKKGDDGKYANDPSIDLSKIDYGALRIDFPNYGQDATGVFYIDYLAFFADEAEANAFAQKSIDNLANDKPSETEEAEGFSYIKGYTDGTFGPDKNMTRAEAITVMARLVGNDEMIAEKRSSKFTDIKEGDWYFNAIAFLESLGMLENYKDVIEPNKKITRAEFIKLAYEANAFEYSNKRPNFPDLTTDHPYYKELCLGYAAGAITGFNDGTLGPDKEITRAQIVTIINRILDIPASEAQASFSDIDGHWAKGAIMASVGK